jgi:hypothetical protein
MKTIAKTGFPVRLVFVKTFRYSVRAIISYSGISGDVKWRQVRWFQISPTAFGLTPNYFETTTLLAEIMESPNVISEFRRAPAS